MQYIENESFYSAFDILLVVVSIELFTFGVFFAVIPFNRKDYWSIAIVLWYNFRRNLAVSENLTSL